MDDVAAEDHEVGVRADAPQRGRHRVLPAIAGSGVAHHDERQRFVRARHREVRIDPAGDLGRHPSPSLARPVPVVAHERVAERTPHGKRPGMADEPRGKVIDPLAHLGAATAVVRGDFEI
jgi:hypothetical protein